MIVDLFAGPGGWDEGILMLDPDREEAVVGIEIDEYACRTATKAGHIRWHQDVLKTRWHDLAPIRGLVASPPCQAFSQGGHGEGRKEEARFAMLHHILECGSAGEWIEPTGILCEQDIRADLTLQPLKWAMEARPEWMAFEQVPAVSTHWYAMCETLTDLGYSAATKVMNFEDYGLPQFRSRAILLASRVGDVRWPERTHEDLRHHSTLFQTLKPWTSIADVFELEPDCETLRRPAATVTGGGGKDNGTGIFLDKQFRYKLRTALGRESGGVLAPHEAGMLQGFRSDYPWFGPLGDKYMQIGNAMPPTMAVLLLEQFI